MGTYIGSITLSKTSLHLLLGISKKTYSNLSASRLCTFTSKALYSILGSIAKMRMFDQKVSPLLGGVESKHLDNSTLLSQPLANSLVFFSHPSKVGMLFIKLTKITIHGFSFYLSLNLGSFSLLDPMVFFFNIL